jgi:hypothetical protein
MSDVRYRWQQPVLAALMELNPEKLEEMIGAALNAIEARRAERNGNADSRDEHVALQDALNSLNGLRRVAREKDIP